jgi:hypothetical protein
VLNKIGPSIGHSIHSCIRALRKRSFPTFCDRHRPATPPRRAIGLLATCTTACGTASDLQSGRTTYAGEFWTVLAACQRLVRAKVGCKPAAQRLVQAKVGCKPAAQRVAQAKVGCKPAAQRVVRAQITCRQPAQRVVRSICRCLRGLRSLLGRAVMPPQLAQRVVQSICRSLCGRRGVVQPACRGLPDG